VPLFSMEFLSTLEFVSPIAYDQGTFRQILVLLFHSVPPSQFTDFLVPGLDPDTLYKVWMKADETIYYKYPFFELLQVLNSQYLLPLGISQRNSYHHDSEKILIHGLLY
jgi:hypothetical protein